MANKKINYKNCWYCLFLWVVLSVAACTEKAPVYPELEGYWQEERIVDEVTGVDKECARLYWAFQLGVSEIRDLGANGWGIHVCRYEYDEAHRLLRMWDFREKENQSQNSAEEMLEGFGIPSSDVTFEVVKADGDHLVLRCEGTRLYFRSF